MASTFPPLSEELPTIHSERIDLSGTNQPPHSLFRNLRSRGGGDEVIMSIARRTRSVMKPEACDRRPTQQPSLPFNSGTKIGL